MKDRNSSGQAKNKKKQESALITKESISAVCALFSVLVLLILCTDSMIFGEIGRLTQDFFLGVFGYFAYPTLLGALYLSASTFLDKRWVKNRFAFLWASLSLVTLLLVLQTAFTYSWAIDGYAAACFVAGESFATTTLLGWLGGIVLSLSMNLVGKIGTLIVFSLLCLLGIYATAIACGNKLTATKRKERKAKMQRPVKEHVQVDNSQPVQASNPNEQQANAYPPMQRESFSGSSYSYAPRPSVIINENDYYNNVNAQAHQNQSGFSPFGGYSRSDRVQPTSSEDKLPTGAEERRQFLLGSTPAEIYQKNLIFDSNASVNKRPPANPDQQSYRTAPSQTLGMQDGFTSYTGAYEESLNANKQTPTVDYQEPLESESAPIERTSFAERESYLNVEETGASRLNVDDSREDSSFAFGRSSRFENNARETENASDSVPLQSFDRDVTPTVNEQSATSQEGYRRHDYMDYFSLSNPNIFGNGRESSDRDLNLGTDRTSRSFPDAISRNESTVSENFRGRDDTPSSFTNDRSLVNDRSIVSDRDLTRNSGFGFQHESPQEEETTDALNIFDDEPMTDANTNVPTTEPERKTDFGDREVSRNLQSVPFRRETVSAQPNPPQEEKTEEAPQKKPRVYRPYVPAPLHYFDCSDIIPDADPLEIEEAKTEILNVYERNGVTGIAIDSVVFGPTLTRYNLSFDCTTSPKKFITKDIESSMSIALRVKNGVNMYINYEERLICIETPNKKRQTVQLGCMLTGSKYVDAKPGSLVFSIGKDIVNKKLYGDLSEMVHMLVAGSTGSGKSVFLNTLIVSLINRYSPQEVRLILIDPKRTEFVIYSDLPHLMINEIITDPRKAIQSFNWAIGEMNRRYELFSKMSKEGKHVVNLDEYNAAVPQEERLPKIVIVVDELADLMLASKKEVEERIQNITQKSRAAGIHMIIATQRPSVDVITGVIKANLATRFAFMVASDIDSRVILDASGAQKLLGYGDMLYCKVGSRPTRAQSAFISSSDCQKVVNFIRENNDAYFDETATNYINNSGHAPVGDDEGGEALVEEVYIEALKLVILSNTASISMIQRKCSVGYNKAGKIVEWMEDMGYISPYDGAKARKVLISKEEFEELYGPI